MGLKNDASKFFLGYLWWVLEPILFVAVFYVVFEIFLNSRTGNFVVFLICGKFCFVWFSKSVTQASRSIVAAKGLIGKLHIPKALFPLAQIQEGLYKQVAVFALLFLIVITNGYGINQNWLWLPSLMLLQYLLIVFFGLAAAVLVCLFYDFSPMIQIGMVFLMFVSGIFWDPRSLPDPEMTELILTLNPIAFLLDAYRGVLLSGVPPNLQHMLYLGASLLAGIFFILLYMHKYTQYLALRALES